MQFCHENLQKVFVWLKRITHEKMLFQLYRVHNMWLGRSFILWFELQLFSIVYHVFDFPFLMSAIILLLLLFSLSPHLSMCVYLFLFHFAIHSTDQYIYWYRKHIIVFFFMYWLCRFDFYQSCILTWAENEEWVLKMPHLVCHFIFLFILILRVDSLHFPFVHFSFIYIHLSRDFLPNAFQIWLTFHLFSNKILLWWVCWMDI